MERSGTVGRREPPPAWPGACCGRRMRVLTSHESGWRGICCRRALVASCVMLPRVFPEGTSREGGTRLREAPGLDAALQHEVTCSQRPADHVTARWDAFAARSLDLILTDCDARMRHPTSLTYHSRQAFYLFSLVVLSASLLTISVLLVVITPFSVNFDMILKYFEASKD